MSRSRSQTGKSDHQIDLFAEDIAAETPTVPAAGDTTFDINDLLSSPDRTETLLLHWQQAEWIRALDVGFARLIRELSEEQGERPDPLLLLLAALVDVPTDLLEREACLRELRPNRAHLGGGELRQRRA